MYLPWKYDRYDVEYTYLLFKKIFKFLTNIFCLWDFPPNVHKISVKFFSYISEYFLSKFLRISLQISLIFSLNYPQNFIKYRRNVRNILKKIKKDSCSHISRKLRKMCNRGIFRVKNFEEILEIFEAIWR